MTPASLAGDAFTGTRDQTGAPGTRAPAPVTPGRTSGARAKTRGDSLRRIVGWLRRVPKARASYYDPLFGRPDLIEDDYYRLRNQHRS